MFGLNRNVWILVCAQPFALAMSPAIVLISGFVGKELAPSPQLATLPLTMLIVGIMLGAMPAALLMQRFGRKKVFLGSTLISASAALIAALGIHVESFIVFLAGTTLSGMTLAVVQQFRFAVVEGLERKELASRAVSVLMLGSVAAAFIGTELASAGQYVFSHAYVGSFLAMIIANVVSFTLLLFFTNPAPVKVNQTEKAAINWAEVLMRPRLIIAVAAATIGYGVMSFVMTATPLAMSDLMGHSLDSTKWVIQSHIMAMFLPSLITGELIRKIGALSVIFMGLVAYFLTTAVAYSGVEVFHYWWALVLLGIGWNFLFIGGTSLLTTTYNESEKYRVQATNDMVVFVFQALSSFSAGAILFVGGWSSVVTVSLVPTVFLLLILTLLFKKAQLGNKQGVVG